MKIVIASDSHGLRDPLTKIISDNKDAEYFLHCGDICLDTWEFPKYITVCGNNDYYDYPLEVVLNLGGHKILMLHSHTVNYFKRTEKLVEKAKANDCDIVCFGHSHIAMHEIVDGVHLINPGSLYHSRDGRKPSYAVLEIDENTFKIEVKFIFVDR